MQTAAKRIPPERIEEFRRRYLAGEKRVVIRHEMGIGGSTYENWIHRLGLPLRRPWRKRRPAR